MRITRTGMLLTMAETVAQRGTCNRLLVGALIVRDFRVISQGYNGVPSKVAHCNHMMNDDTPCSAAVHAEANALVFAARHGIATDGAEMFVTHAPCVGCARLIVNAGISRVTFKTYFRDQSGLELLTEAGVAWERSTC